MKPEISLHGHVHLTKELLEHQVLNKGFDSENRIDIDVNIQLTEDLIILIDGKKHRIKRIYKNVWGDIAFKTEEIGD